jgi:anti-sigma28 factor (negative regulator of flagellin synthesis)
MLTMSYRDVITTTQPGISSAPSSASPIRTSASALASDPKLAKTGVVSAQDDQSSFSLESKIVSQALATKNDRTVDIGALKGAIASGEYHVSASKVADKLLDSLVS